MGRRLLTTSPRLTDSGELLVNYSANREGGLQIGKDTPPPSPNRTCVPFAEEPTLADRKFLLLTIPIDTVWIGPGDVVSDTGYISRGAIRGGTLTQPPGIVGISGPQLYSNRKQLLRGQYLRLATFSKIELCATVMIAAIEQINSVEAS